MNQISSINVADIVRRTLNHVDERLVNHGERVAFVALKLLQENGKYDLETIRNICFLTMLHDIGAYKTEEINNMLQFETGNVWNHSVYGYLFVKYLSPFSEFAPMILYHHTDYEKLNNLGIQYENLAQLLNLSDRVDVYMASGEETPIIEYIESFQGKKFSSEIVELFKRADVHGHIIEKLSDGSYLQDLQDALGEMPFTKEEIDIYLNMIVYAIDFRSPHTVIHTITTRSISEELGRKMNQEEEALTNISYAALLHDLGKIGIPVEILEYKGKLSPQAMRVMKTHVAITEEILNGEIDEEVIRIALRHHEKLDGSGYPLGLKGVELSLNEKIMAVADIVSALSGKRSYKEAFDKKTTISIICKMADDGLISPEVVAVMADNFDVIMERVRTNCEFVIEVYTNISREYISLREQCLLI